MLARCCCCGPGRLEVWLKGEHPRKELLDYMGRKHCARMYQEDQEGNSHHIGYVVGGHWFQLYTVTPWEGKI